MEHLYIYLIPINKQAYEKDFFTLRRSCPFVEFLQGAAPKEELVINLQEKGAEVASSMYGIFFEEINHAGDGGLYAELVKNRSFEELEMPEGYYAEGDVLHPKKCAITFRVK